MKNIIKYIVIIVLCIILVVLLIFSKNNSNNLINIEYISEEYNYESEDKTVIVSNTRTLPVIDGTLDSLELIEESITSISDESWEEIKEETDILKNYQEEPLECGVNLTMSTSYITSNTVTFNIYMEGGFGGVSWLSSESYTYDLSTGKELSIKDVVSDEGLEYIYNKIISDLKENYDTSEFWDFEDESWKDLVKDEYVKAGVWQMQENGILFQFGKYTIAPGSYGLSISSLISYDEIKSYIKINI